MRGMQVLGYIDAHKGETRVTRIMLDNMTHKDPKAEAGIDVAMMEVGGVDDLAVGKRG